MTMTGPSKSDNSKQFENKSLKSASAHLKKKKKICKMCPRREKDFVNEQRNGKGG